MTEREALKLALEALKHMCHYTSAQTGYKGQIVADALYAIDKALAQPSVSVEQEPVATLDDLEQEIYENTRQFVSRDVMEWMLKRYYTTPPQRTWVGLTDVERRQAVNAVTYSQLAMTHAEWVDEVQKETERRLREKNT